MAVPVTVVDDSKISRKMVIRALPPEWNIKLTQAENGEEALAAYRDGKAEVMFLDLTMPVMDGYDATRAIRENEVRDGGTDDRIPVIAMTANAQSEDRQKCLNAGMDDYIQKPVRQEALKSVLQKYL